MRRLAVLVAAGLLAGFPALAGAGDQTRGSQPGPAPGGQQEAGRPLLQLGGGLIVGVPVGDFGRNVDVAGGLAGQIDFGLGQSVFSMGVEGSYQWYGSESRTAPLSPTIPEIVVTVTTDNELWTVHGRFRAQRREGRWRPYVDALVGTTGLRTSSRIDQDFDETDLSTTNLSDTVFSYGGGAGLTIGFGPPPDLVRLDLSLRYLAGGEARYLTEGGIRNEAGIALLDIRRSRTDMLLVYVGVAVGR
jgi:hypothetical protein